MDGRDGWHERVLRWYSSEMPELATTPLVVAEVDHLAGARAGEVARAAWRKDLLAGAYLVEWWNGALRQSVEIASKYQDLGVDLTDSSLVALADRLETHQIATLDERHFRAMQPLARKDAFKLLPIDA